MTLVPLRQIYVFFPNRSPIVLPFKIVSLCAIDKSMSSFPSTLVFLSELFLGFCELVNSSNGMSWMLMVDSSISSCCKPVRAFESPHSKISHFVLNIVRRLLSGLFDCRFLYEEVEGLM